MVLSYHAVAGSHNTTSVAAAALKNLENAGCNTPLVALRLPTTILVLPDNSWLENFTSRYESA
jgi:hypothetical protein